MADNTTSISLLHRLQQPKEAAAWERFVELYTPMIRSWIKRQGLSDTDAEDLAQDVVVVLLKKLPEFQYSPEKSFRGWLRTIAVNKSRDFFRRKNIRKEAGDGLIAGLAVDPEHLEFIEEPEYRAQLVSQALRIMQSDFRTTTWQACWQSLVEGRPIEEVATSLDITPNAVYVARSRVLRRLREELEGLL